MTHTKCDYCNKDLRESDTRVIYRTGGLNTVNRRIITFPFVCRRCGGTFCEKHRLPENHECPRL